MRSMSRMCPSMLFSRLTTVRFWVKHVFGAATPPPVGGMP